MLRAWLALEPTRGLVSHSEIRLETVSVSAKISPEQQSCSGLFRLDPHLRIEAVSTASRHPSTWDIEARTYAILWTADPNLR